MEKRRRKAHLHSEFLFNRQLLNSKRSQGAIIVSVLIVLIVIVAIMIVWNIVFPLVKQKSGEIEIGSFTTDLKIGKASVGTLGNSKITITRGSQGDLDGIKFVFYNKEGKSVSEDVYDVLDKLETKEYSFDSLGLVKINKIEVYPIVNDKFGIKDESEVIKELSSYLVLSWNQGDGQTISGLSFSNNLGISFWVNGSENKDLINQSYTIKTVDQKIRFSYRGDVDSSNELNDDWNHVVVSIGPVSTIYINNEYSGNFSTSSFNSFGDIKVGDVDDLMIFNKSLDINSVSSLYNSQLR